MITFANYAASNTPEQDVYALCATVLSNAGWTLMGDAPVTIVNSTYGAYTWRNPGSTMYVMIDLIPISSGITRLHIRVSEAYDVNAATNKMKWQPPASRGTVSYTPTINYAPNDSFGPPNFTNYISTYSSAYAGINLVRAGGKVMLGANATQFFIMANHDSFGSAVICAYIGGSESGAELWPQDSAVALVQLSGQYSNFPYVTQSSPSYGGNVRYSREPLTTSSTQGAFTGHIAPSSTSERGNDWGWTLPTLITGSHKWLTSYVVAPAWIHGITTSYWATRSHRAKLSNFVVQPNDGYSYLGGNDNKFTPGSSFLVNGQPHYWLGAQWDLTFSTSHTLTSSLIGVNGSAF